MSASGSRAPLFERLTLIGLGLEGSSIAWAAKRGGLAGEIVGGPGRRHHSE